MEQCELCGGLLLLDHVCDPSEVELMKDMKAHLIKANTVYVVESWTPYNVESIFMEGIFSSEEKAKAYILQKDPDWTPSTRNKDLRYRIYHVIVDAVLPQAEHQDTCEGCCPDCNDHCPAIGGTSCGAYRNRI